ncbi:hypothetical protein SCUP515_06049 [Seiridium cupressi]
MSILSQIFPPCPTFTEKDLPDLKGKVYIVTGAAAGIGLELARMLYGKNGTVYIATRSVEKINRAFGNIKASYPNSQGTLQELVLDLANLATIKPAVQKFLAQEQRLDVLFHNAGVMVTPVDAKTVQGHELQLGTNTIGPFLLTRLLEPILVSTAKQSPTGSVRIVWVASIIALGTPKGGVVWDKQLDGPTLLDSPGANYMQSKAGLVFLAHEYARKLGKEGILSMSLHPGLTKTELQRHMPAPVRALMGIVFKGPEAGALTEIFAGFSPEITQENNGRYIIPWGRFGPLPEHVSAGLKSKDEGVSILMVHWQNIHTPINLDATLPVQVETLFPLIKPDPEPSDPTLTFTSQRRISGTFFPLNSAQQDFKLQSGYSAYSFASRGAMAEQRNESASKAKFTFIPLDQLEKWKMTLKCLYGATVVVSMEEGKYDLDLSIVELPKAKILTEEEIRNKEPQEKRAMIVSSQQIIKWFPKWEQYIVATATVTPAGSFGVVHLPFKGKGFLDLVGIAHEAPTTDEESALASLANHLDETRIDQLIFSSVHQLLDPALPKWLSHDLRSLGHARWLEVAYQFGLEDIFQRAAWQRPTSPATVTRKLARVRSTRMIASKPKNTTSMVG